MELLDFVFACFCLLTSTTYGLSKLSGVRLEENGYTGVIVRVSSDVPENPRLVEIIKEMFVNASSDLYQATKRRAYFRDVTIILPSSWAGDQWNKSTQNVTYRYVDLTITQSRETLGDKFLEAPYTKQIEGCGKPGVSIYMTSQFIQEYPKFQHLYGHYGKILVHEWGHYRWGLLDEYPDEETEGKTPKSFYFSTKTQRWQPVGCSDQWDMVALERVSDSSGGFTYVVCEGNDVTGYEQGCVAFPTSATHRKINGSVMEGNLNLQEVAVFCDNDPNDPTTFHNSEAPNRQNLQCGGKSTWEVMREHEDFKGERNPPRNVANLTPLFYVIRARPPRVVFVIDNSVEMIINDRMSEVTTAVNCFITSMIPDGTLAGLVVVGSHAYVVRELHKINLADSSGKSENWLQVNVSSDTDSRVDRGLTAALKVLSQQNDSGGGKVVLITAGKGGNSTSMVVVEREYARQGIVIDAIIYNGAAANIFDIVDATDGKVYLQTNTSGVEGLLEALNDIMTETGSKFSLKAENSSSRGEIYANTCSTKKDDVRPLYSAEDACPTEVSVRINWDAFPSGLSLTKSFAIYAEVHRCEDPIIGAEVTAFVERPTGALSQLSIPFELKLLDTGTGADLRRDDGVYSRYFIEFTGPGIYGITVEANNYGSAKVVKSLRNRLPRSYINRPISAEDLLSGNFSLNGTDAFFPGMPVGDFEGESLHNFTIGAAGGATRVESSPDTDTIPPTKITDLVILSQSAENATVTLTFTAPGDDLDFGQALRYYIYKSSTREQLLNNASVNLLVRIEDIIEGNVSSPSEYGTTETFVVRVHLPRGIETVWYYFGVIAEDDAGNRGELSTLVQAVFQNLTDAFTTTTVPGNNFTTTIIQNFTTGTYTDKTARTLQPVSVSVTTKSIPPTQPSFCESRVVVCILFVSLCALSFLWSVSALIISLYSMRLIHNKRKRNKVSSTYDVELRDQTSETGVQTLNRT